MQYIPKFRMLAKILYSGLQCPVISLTATLNPRCFCIDCYLNDYETNGKGTYMTIIGKTHCVPLNILISVFVPVIILSVRPNYFISIGYSI